MDARLLRAAREGNIYAMLAVAYSFQNGREAPIDPQSAIEWYTRSANKGCSRAKWELAKMYRFGNLVKPDKEKYLEWLMASAEGGTPEARRELAARYLHGSLVPRDEVASFEWLKSAAAQKDPLSIFRLAYSYKYGVCCKSNPREAERLFHEVSVLGDAELFFRIGMDYEFGMEMITPDIGEASKWYTRGAKMGHDRCYFCLTRVKSILKGDAPDTYESRISMLKKTMSSVEEAERAALLEEADNDLEGEMYEEALEKYHQAAELGNSEAMYMLAILYHEGELVKRNDPLAFDFLTRASLSGSTEAQLLLGKSYETGRGKKRNDEEAVKYYAMAAAAGNLVGYYELSRFMDHPEIFVRSTQKVVR